AAWARAPIYFENFWHLEYVKAFVLATWWIGAIAGAILLWQRGSRWADVLCGAVAGAVAGLAGAATLACLLPLLDAPPRWLLRLVSGRSTGPGSAWLWTPVWLMLVVIWWTVAGTLVGFGLSLAGRIGRAVLTGLGWPLA